jgi:HSP20 family molecular chaperone IbpA
MALALTDKGTELLVMVEVPGLAAGDLDLMITPGGLIIRGETCRIPIHT